MVRVRTAAAAAVGCTGAAAVGRTHPVVLPSEGAAHTQEPVVCTLVELAVHKRAEAGVALLGATAASVDGELPAEADTAGA